MGRLGRDFKKAKDILARSENTKKIFIYFATLVAGDDFDPFEKNFTRENLNPKVIRGYVREISAQSLIFKEYGLHEMGAVEILVDEKFKDWFENAARIVIDDEEYQPFTAGVGNRSTIQKRPLNLIRVILQRKD